MYIPFDQLPDTARLWVYQANRPLTDAESARITQTLSTGLERWAAHGQPLRASAKVLENRFIWLAVDQAYTLPSGCSIDASVQLLRDVGQTSTGEAIDFFDRSLAFQNPNNQIATVPISGIKAAIAEGMIAPETLVFNTLAATVGEAKKNWLIPAYTSWLKRYFVGKTVIG